VCIYIYILIYWSAANTTQAARADGAIGTMCVAVSI
jgi:hypothetical protein